MTVLEKIVASAVGLDLSGRIVANQTVVASPSAATETIIGSIAIPEGLSIVSGVIVIGWSAFTVGTSGVSVTHNIRQTSVSGTTIQSSGATTATATNLNERTIFAYDTSPSDGQVYKYTMTVGSGAAASTVSAVTMIAVVV